MKTHYHFLISFLAGSIYLLLVGKSIDLINLLPWFIGGVLIDIDHFFTYSAKTKTFNLKKLIRPMLNDYNNNNQHFYIFHTFEFAIFFAFVILKTSLTWQYLAGYLLHIFCDGLRHRRLKKNYSWLKKWMLVYSLKLKVKS